MVGMLSSRPGTAMNDRPGFFALFDPLQRVLRPGSIRCQTPAFLRFPNAAVIK